MTTSKLLVAAAVLSCGFALAAAPKAPAKTDAVDPAAKKEAETVFATRCATCHGAQGKGDGAAAGALNPKPTNFQDAAWQKAAKDPDIEKVIVEGGASIGKSPLMAPNADLKGKPVVAALRAHIRGLAKK